MATLLTIEMDNEQQKILNFSDLIEVKGLQRCLPIVLFSKIKNNEFETLISISTHSIQNHKQLRIKIIRYLFLNN